MKTSERLAVLETDVKYIKEKLDEFVECADKKYASKLTEKIVYTLCGAILLAFITKVLNLW
jgi:uncharacterized Rmd1/YagE family protein